MFHLVGIFHQNLWWRCLAWGCDCKWLRLHVDGVLETPFFIVSKICIDSKKIQCPHPGSSKLQWSLWKKKQTYLRVFQKNKLQNIMVLLFIEEILNDHRLDIAKTHRKIMVNKRPINWWVRRSSSNQPTNQPTNQPIEAPGFLDSLPRRLRWCSDPWVQDWKNRWTDEVPV